MHRRELLKFLGYSLALSHLPSCATPVNRRVIPSLSPSFRDELKLVSGLSYQVLISEGDPINSKEFFGAHNDYIAYKPLSGTEGILWVNHEYFNSLFTRNSQEGRTAIEVERKLVGGSLLKLAKENGQWKVVIPHSLNRRIDGTTKIPFEIIADNQTLKVAEGTVSNCAGGITPWGTFLSCEENYEYFYGERLADGKIKASGYGWEHYYPDNIPEHYGWVVEIEPETGRAKKHLTLGRFAHECATCVVARDGRAVVYSGDDKNDGCLYKFIADNPDSLSRGTLYVADFGEGHWIPLDYKTQVSLRKYFRDQIHVYIDTRRAANILGGTKLDRPEDIEINPLTGDIFVSLTNNKPKGNYHGSIIKLREEKGDYLSLKFEAETLLLGGEGGFSSPDNLVFDQRGNLWFCSDISGRNIGKGPYESFGNNGLFLVPAHGPQAGEVLQLASAPNDAELTGLCFTPDEQTLFLSVQHPGEQTKDIHNPTSRWPMGSHLPKSSVVQIQGELLEQLKRLD